ncbi:protein-L-isoaspartate(D-aspartate) O-methyltransferase [Candidatus Woesearchaeota archaeon]|nr:protein-L-isoaspartate(D-aspartate) O-methyltransferase [Candidatus Woesearchaeota archaeon]MBT4321579.1 protein-L-isoaspartate(D-aspartate) O-methyltransferase [Candidatus Woesearchaeota archaeon]MBT4631110.1 protein-L-isoaspartate(D-aspartate) O-methyltransferase [Candidatus Woesearchaeota archaeon]
MKNTLIKFWKNSYNFDKKIMLAFRDIPREKFVLKKYKNEAYADMALPLLMGQTISQPTTIMIMLNALEVKRGENVLEIGTGSGYQTALLSKLVGPRGKVTSLEVLPELIDFAKKNLRKIKLDKNIKIVKIDGSKGYEKFAPYDKIIVAAASPKINQVLLSQLIREGVMVLPVGKIYEQKLLKITKSRDLRTENLGEFLFVPLRGENGY